MNKPHVTVGPALDAMTAERAAEPAVETSKDRGAGQPAPDRDIAGLETRIRRMFSTLDRNLSKKVAETRAEEQAVLLARIEELEHAVNGLEGMLRIDLSPEFRSVLNETLDDRKLGTSRTGNPFWITFGLGAAALAAGAVFHAELAAAAQSALDFILGILG